MLMWQTINTLLRIIERRFEEWEDSRHEFIKSFLDVNNTFPGGQFLTENLVFNDTG